jgi:hypothetical protein
MWVASGAWAQALQQQVEYEARDSIRYDMRTQMVYLYGAATVKYGDVQLTADRIGFSFKNEEAIAFGVPDSTGNVTGKPNFVQAGHAVEADSIRYNFKTKQGLIREVRTQEQETWVHAALSKRHANAEVHSRGGMLTTCDRPYPHYHFKVSKMIVIPDDKIVTGPAYMKFGRKIPTPLAVPFGFFPNKKGGSSGILIPTYGNSDQFGYFLLNGGYYIPVSDRLDQQITGDIYSRGSWALRSLTRYKTRYRYNGNLDLSRNVMITGQREFPDYTRQVNFFVRWNHLVDPRASLTDRFNASVNFGTSNHFTNNLNSSQYDYLSNTFQSNISWTHLWPSKPYNIGVNLRHSQNTLTRQFDITVPSITFNVQRFFPFQVASRPARRWYDQIGISLTSNFDNRLSIHEDSLRTLPLQRLLRRMQNGFRHTASVSSTFKTKFFTVNPEFRVTDRMYFQQLRRTTFLSGEELITSTDTLPRFAAPFEWSAGANLTSKLYGMYNLRGDRVQAIRHVITPNAGFNYTPGNNTEVYGPFGSNGTWSSYSPYDIGIYGKPAGQESGALNLGLIQSLEAKVRDGKATGTEVASKKIRLIDFVGINSSYDLLRDSLKWSPVSLNARTALFNRINVNHVSVWDPLAVNDLGQRIDRSERSVTGKLARMIYTNWAIGFDVKSPKYGQPINDTPAAGADQTVVEDSDPSRGARVDFRIPWRLNVNYSHDINRSYLGGGYTNIQRQSVIFNGDFNIMKWWKIGFSSGYDLTAEEWTPTTLNLYWDLHCWEMNLNVIPIGLRRSFTFRINVKASVLRDLKFEQRRPIGTDGNYLY